MAFARWCIGFGALALVSFAACKTEEVAPATDAGVVDADVPEVAPPDAEVADAATTCPGPTPSTYPWKKPVAADLSACTEQDLAKLAKAISEKKIKTESDIATALGTSCASCAVGKLADPEWRAIVGDHAGYIGNVGGCVVRLGASETCGQATDALSTCLIVGCAGCTNRKEQDVCADALTSVDGACAKSLTTMRASCSAPIVSAAFSATGTCQSFVETVRLFCGPRPSDGGTD